MGAASRHDIDPRVPGRAPTCIDHQQAIEEQQRAHGEIARELSEVQTAIGEVPDPTATEDDRSGHGIKGALARILAQLEVLTGRVDELGRRVDELAKRRSEPPPASTAQWGKRVGWILLILALGMREARTIYSEITGAHAGQLPTTSQRSP